jgi:hypothetical protein
VAAIQFHKKNLPGVAYTAGQHVLGAVLKNPAAGEANGPSNGNP